MKKTKTTTTKPAMKVARRIRTLKAVLELAGRLVRSAAEACPPDFPWLPAPTPRARPLAKPRKPRASRRAA